MSERWCHHLPQWNLRIQALWLSLMAAKAPKQSKKCPFQPQHNWNYHWNTLKLQGNPPSSPKKAINPPKKNREQKSFSKQKKYTKRKPLTVRKGFRKSCKSKWECVEETFTTTGLPGISYSKHRIFFFFSGAKSKWKAENSSLYIATEAPVQVLKQSN